MAPEGAFPVGQDDLLCSRDVGVDPSRLLVDRDHVVHQLELSPLQAGGHPQPGGRVRVGDRVFVHPVDLQLGHDEVRDVLQDGRLAAEGRVDRRGRNVGGLGDGGDRGRHVATLGEQAAGGPGDLVLGRPVPAAGDESGRRA